MRFEEKKEQIHCGNGCGCKRMCTCTSVFFFFCSMERKKDMMMMMRMVTDVCLFEAKARFTSSTVDVILSQSISQ